MGRPDPLATVDVATREACGLIARNKFERHRRTSEKELLLVCRYASLMNADGRDTGKSTQILRHVIDRLKADWPALYREINFDLD